MYERRACWHSSPPPVRNKNGRLLLRWFSDKLSTDGRCPGLLTVQRTDYSTLSHTLFCKTTYKMLNYILFSLAFVAVSASALPSVRKIKLEIPFLTKRLSVALRNTVTITMWTNTRTARARFPQWPISIRSGQDTFIASYAVSYAIYTITHFRKQTYTVCRQMVRRQQRAEGLAAEPV